MNSSPLHSALLNVQGDVDFTSATLAIALAKTRLASSITIVSLSVSLVKAYALLPIWGMVGLQSLVVWL